MSLERAARAPLPLWAALLTALLAGPVLDSAYPSLGIWPLAPVALGLLFVALRGRRAGASLLVGFVFGAAFYLVHIEWATLFLGVVPWAALSLLQALFVALGAVLVTLAYRWVPLVWPGPAGRIGLLPIVVAALWTLREQVSSTWPYGGFAWGRIGQSQSASPMNDWFGWIGTAGVSFLVVWFTAFALEFVVVARSRRRATLAFTSTGPVWRRTPGMRAVLIGVTAAVVALLLPTPWQSTESGTMRVAAVQGDTNSGYFQQRAYQGEILDGHIAATLPVLDAGADVIVWPEGASDLSPLESRAAAGSLELIADAAEAPIVLGAITEREDEFFNSSLLWQPGVGVVDLYDKRHPVPFGEYVPDREFWEPFAPDLIGLIGREYTPGTNDPVFEIAGIPVGVNICFDIIDDALMRETALGGAEVIFAQTNNADFGETDESAQQQAFARIRTLELGRSIVNISTVSASAVIGPDGETLDALPAFEAGAMVVDVPLQTGLSPYALWGGHLERFIGWFGLGMLLAAWALARGRRALRR